MKTKIFITGASGFQGNAIANELLKKEYEITSLKREISGNENANINFIQGDLINKENVLEATKNTEITIFTLPLVFDLETAKTMTENFIEAAKENSIELVVFNTSFDLPKEKTGLTAIDIKVEIKKMFNESGLNVITLAPDIFIDNLAAPWSIPLVVEQGILPYPVAAGKKFPWISHHDLAKFAVNAIEHKELIGKTLAIGGNLVSGEEIAKEISAKIGKEVNFIPLSPDDFEQNLIPAFGEIPAREISNLYRYVADNYENLIQKDFNNSQEILDVEIQSTKDWVESISWS
ncbi:SDR family oxidoreductase [Aureivirga sp. CE67]|uniref:SDR family oxidoreductase n=1 Tax=Aureivirga sp. CE67 TaxID=1788983 RepID=UPI0018C9D265|nr:NmrA family NAD(P)-binding protein [Aureivirga sp. CE67]